MKRLIVLLFAIAMFLCLAACDTSEMEESRPDSESIETIETTEPTTHTEGNAEHPEAGQKDTTIRVPGEKIYFYAPSGWEVEKENLSTVVQQSKDCLVSICYNWPWPITEERDLTNVIAELGYNFTSDASSESRGYIVNSTIEVTSTEKSTVAGYDCVIFTGVVDNDGNWDCHVYGYTFVVNNVELMVVGLVSTQEQDEQMIADINALTDQIAASVRTEK
jgi:hypothetical protein